MDDHTILKLIGSIVLLGPFPVACVVWNTDRGYVVCMFFIAYVLGYIFTVFLGIWVLILFLPAAWYFALKPMIDRFTF